MTYIDNESFLTPEDYGFNEEENSPVSHDGDEREDTNILRVPEHEENDYERTRRLAAEKLDKKLDKNLQRAENIWKVIEIKRKELEEKGDNSPIFLIKAGSYVAESYSIHRKIRHEGHLEKDILVTIDKENGKKLNLLCSFDENNDQKFGIYYTRPSNSNGHAVLETTIQNKGDPDHLGRPWAIDSNLIKDVDHLEALLK